MEEATFFLYKTQKTFMHTLPPPLKILLIILLALTAFYLPVKICLILYPILILFSACILKFRIHEIFSDIKPVFAYIILLYGATVLLNLTNFLGGKITSPAGIFIPNLTYLPLLAHLALSLEITSIFYRTTSQAQFKEGFASIETFFTRSSSTPLSDSLALALSFIPKISLFWNRLEKAWSSRGGSNTVKKAFILFPKLFHVSLREGYEKSLAIQNRSL